MQSFREYYWFETSERRSYIRITDKVEGSVKKIRHTGGLCPRKRHAHYSFHLRQ